MALPLVPIYTQTVGAGAPTTISFLNIPQFYTDIKLCISARSAGNTNDNLRLTINGNSASVYSSTNLYGDGVGAYSERTSSLILDFAAGYIPNTASTANTFGNCEIYIPNYTSNNFKSVLSDNVAENNSASTFVRQVFGAGLYRNTTTITRLDVTSFLGFSANSTFSLYGIIRSGA